jgi:hypothetical protein
MPITLAVVDTPVLKDLVGIQNGLRHGLSLLSLSGVKDPHLGCDGLIGPERPVYARSASALSESAYLPR